MDNICILGIIPQPVHRGKAYGSGKSSSLPVWTGRPEHICKVIAVTGNNLIFMKLRHKSAILPHLSRKIRNDAQVLGRRQRSKIRQLLQNIKLLQVLPESPKRNETAAGLIQALAPLLLPLISQQASGEKEVSSALRIKEYIDAHYLEELKLSTIASALHVSTYYLSHTFKDLTGDSPLQYIIKRRMDAAQNLLLTTNYSITDIAMRCGYNNSNYFQYVFNHLIGMPPGKYWKAWKGNRT